MPNPARFSVVALSLFVASIAAPAAAEMDDDGTTPLEAVDTGRTDSLDAVDTGHTRTLDSVDTGRTETLESVDQGRTESLDAADTGRTEALDEADTGRTEALDSVEAHRGGWQPAECGSFEVALGPLPEDSDSDAWSDKLLEAQQAIKKSKFELERTESAYAQARNFRNAVGAPAARIVAARDEARKKYSQSLCALPQLVEHARRAGVTPGVLRRYEESPANSN